MYDKNNEKFLEINYKKIKLWTDYFYRFEKGYKEDQYFNVFDKKLNNLQSEIDKDKNIIEKLSKFIKNHYNIEDINKLDEESKKIISKLNK